MGFQPAPLTAQLTLVGALPDGSAAVNVWHFRKDVVPFTEGDLKDLCGIVRSWVNLSYKTLFSNQMYFLRCEARSLESEIAPVWIENFLPALQGGVNSPALPNNTSLVMSLRTGLTGRSARGRIYTFGLAEGSVAGNYVAGPTVNNIQIALNLLRTDAALDGFTWVVLSRVQGGVRLPAAVGYPVTSIIALDSRVDTQRRRLPRVYGN